MKRRVRMKPGKGQSAAGMAVGILFCLLGIFVVIPSFGVFGIFWTGMALIITIMNGINAFSDKGITSHEIYIDDGQEPDADRNTWRDDGEDADWAVVQSNIDGAVTHSSALTTMVHTSILAL